MKAFMGKIDYEQQKKDMNYLIEISNDRKDYLQNYCKYISHFDSDIMNVSSWYDAIYISRLHIHNELYSIHMKMDLEKIVKNIEIAKTKKNNEILSVHTCMDTTKIILDYTSNDLSEFELAQAIQKNYISFRCSNCHIFNNIKYANSCDRCTDGHGDFEMYCENCIHTEDDYWDSLCDECHSYCLENN